uniref:Fibronectin type-III domain-containing protein n=1 Tax=Macrostomum lignano TaxID=282301 RepID=A0A1I8GIT7_9PLAT
PPTAPTGLDVQPLAGSVQNQPGCLVTWRQPHSGWRAPSAYRIVWSPRLDDSVIPDVSGASPLQPRIDPERARTRVVDKTVTRLTIRPLNRATLYIVKVRSLAFQANGNQRCHAALRYRRLSQPENSWQRARVQY